MAHAERAGRRIHYALTGSGPPVVLVPGIGSGMKLFGTLPKRFAREGMACVTFDPVGVEPSSALATETYDFADAAADLIAVLDATGIDAAHLVGTSLGGKVALAAAAQHQARVLSLTMLASSAVLSPRARWVYRFFETVAARLDGDDFGAAVAPFLLGRTFHASRPQVVEDMVRAIRPTPMRRQLMVAQARALQTYRGEELARAWGGRTLCVAGEEDTLTAVAEVRATAALFAQARLLAIGNAGHSLLLESAEVFDAVKAFVSG